MLNITHAAVGVIRREDGLVLLGERPVGKPWAGYWEFPGGKVEVDETPIQALVRELQEELGIADVPFADHGMFYYESDDCMVWGALFSCVSHGPFALQEDEIDSVHWLTVDEINARADEFTPDSLKALELWLTRNPEQAAGVENGQ